MARSIFAEVSSGEHISSIRRKMKPATLTRSIGFTQTQRPKRRKLISLKITLPQRLQCNWAKTPGVIAGRVIDAESGAAAKAFLTFMDDGENRHEILAHGNYRALLPPGKDVILMVTTMSPPYHSQRPVAPLRLEPGQEMHMDIPVSKQ
jgi:hypothetical protein